MAKLFNCQAGEQLGKFTAYRAAIVPAIYTLFNKTDALANSYGKISASRWVRRASSSELTPGDAVLVVDLLPTTEGQTVTVAQLAKELDELSFRTELYSLERIEQADVPGQSGIDARAAYKQAVAGLVKRDAILPKLTGGFFELKYLLYAILAVALIFVVWKLVATVKEK